MAIASSASLASQFPRLKMKPRLCALASLMCNLVVCNLTIQGAENNSGTVSDEKMREAQYYKAAENYFRPYIRDKPITPDLFPHLLVAFSDFSKHKNPTELTALDIYLKASLLTQLCNVWLTNSQLRNTDSAQKLKGIIEAFEKELKENEIKNYTWKPVILNPSVPGEVLPNEDPEQVSDPKLKARIRDAAKKNHDNNESNSVQYTIGEAKKSVEECRLKIRDLLNREKLQ